VCTSIDISLKDLPLCGAPMNSPAGVARRVAPDDDLIA
jgi:hypothetical protein